MSRRAMQRPFSPRHLIGEVLLPPDRQTHDCQCSRKRVTKIARGSGTISAKMLTKVSKSAKSGLVSNSNFLKPARRSGMHNRLPATTLGRCHGSYRQR